MNNENAASQQYVDITRKLPYQSGNNAGNNTRNKAARLINAKAIAMVLDAFIALPVWPSETLAIIPRVNTPIQPTVNACIAKEG